jgi:hypothetical protein
MSSLHFGRRLRAAGIHLLISAAVVAVIAWVIFQVWYPSPFDVIAGGLALFTLIAGVDVVMGPALTLVAASPHKPRTELRRDLAIIGLLQLAALLYGLHTIAAARPVYMVFEVDRLRAVTAADIDEDMLANAPAAWRQLPWTGPRLIAAAKPTDPDEVLRSVELAMAGFDIGLVPGNWRPFAGFRDAAWAKTRPVADLVAHYPDAGEAVRAAAAKAGVPTTALRFIPVVSRRAEGVVLVAGPSLAVIAYLPLDGFF